MIHRFDRLSKMIKVLAGDVLVFSIGKELSPTLLDPFNGDPFNGDPHGHP